MMAIKMTIKPKTAGLFLISLANANAPGELYLDGFCNSPVD
jgi:hypothetical protein